MLTIFLFIILSCLIAIIFNLYNKLTDIQYRNVVLTKRFNQFRLDAPRKPKSESPIIRFIPTVYKNGVISRECKLLLSPIENSLELKDLKFRDSVEILDKCECNSVVWFYVKVFDSSEINNKGWIVSHNINTSLENLPKKINYFRTDT